MARMRALDEQVARHTRQMAVSIEKAAHSLQPDEKQGFLEDLFVTDKIIRPPLPLDNLFGLYETNPIHQASIDAKVTDSVGRGWFLAAEQDQQDDAQRVEGELRDWIEDKVKVVPSFSQLVMAAVASMEKVGWGAWEVARDGDEITALYPLPGHTLFATRQDDEMPIYVQVKGEKKVYYRSFGDERAISYETGEEGGEEDDAAHEIIVFRYYTDRSKFYGLPPWLSGIPAIAELTAIREYNVSWFESGGMTDRLIHVAGDDGEAVRDSIHEQIKDAKSRGHTTIVSNGASDTDLSVHLLSHAEGKREGQFLQRREDLVKEILIAHMVPPYRVGWAELGSLGGSAAKEMIAAYRDGVIEPIQQIIEETLTSTIFAEEHGGFALGGFGFRFEDKDWQEESLDTQKAQIGVDLGMLTPAQGAELLGITVPGPDEAPELHRHYYKGVAIGEGFSEATDVVRTFKTALEAVVKAEEAPVVLPEFETMGG